MQNPRAQDPWRGVLDPELRILNRNGLKENVGLPLPSSAASERGFLAAFFSIIVPQLQ